MSKRLAIVGCGSIAKTHARAAQCLGSQVCQIVALSDAEPWRARDFSQQFAAQAQIFTQFSPLLEQARPDAVIVCTPPSSHATIVSQCLQRRTAVLCEKPLTTDVGATRELVRLAISNGVVLRTAAKYRFVDGVVEAKKLLQSGSLGRLERLAIKFGAAVSMKERWHSDQAQSGGGVLMDNGPHAIDLARFLLGELRILDVGLRYGNEYSVENEACLQLTSETCMAISIELSWCQSLGPTYLTIAGERATVEVGWDSTVLSVRDGSHVRQGPVVTTGYDKEEAFSRQLATFCVEIDKPASGPWHREDGARTVELIAAAYEMAHK